MSLRIGIVGNYGHNNNGDEAILTGIINQINSLGNFNITIFSDNPEDMSKRYNLKSKYLKYKKSSKLFSIVYTIVKVFRNLKKVDLLIIGGGQLLMDLYKRAPMLYCMYSLLGKTAGATVVYYCVGVGPINTANGKFFIGLGLKNSKFISVRDKESKDLLDEIYGIGHRVILGTDPAFSLHNLKSDNRTAIRKTIGFTTLPYYNKQYWPKEDMQKYNKYISDLQKTIEMVLNHTDYNIILFSTVYADTISSTDLYNRIVDKSRVINNINNLMPDQILKEINKCDLIVGTRLHSLILSIVCEKPIIGINYQPKVNNFMERVGLGDNCFNIDTLDSETVYYKINSILKAEYELHQGKSSKVLQMMHKESKSNIDMLQQAIEQLKK